MGFLANFFKMTIPIEDKYIDFDIYAFLENIFVLFVLGFQCFFFLD